MVIKTERKQRKSYSAKRWQKIIADWQASGLSKAVYCRQHNITSSVFHRWFLKIGMTKAQPETACLDKTQDSFIPVYVASQPSLSCCSQPTAELRLDITFLNGHKLSLQGAFEWEGLASFLKPLLRDA